MKTNKKDELYLPVGHKRRMFCRVCAQSMMSEVKLLRKHYTTQHNSIGEPQWLLSGQTPLDCIWTNWE